MLPAQPTAWPPWPRSSMTTSASLRALWWGPRHLGTICQTCQAACILNFQTTNAALQSLKLYLISLSSLVFVRAQFMPSLPPRRLWMAPLASCGGMDVAPARTSSLLLLELPKLSAKLSLSLMGRCQNTSCACTALYLVNRIAVIPMTSRILQQAYRHGLPCSHPQCVSGRPDSPSGEASKWQYNVNADNI